MGSKTLTSTSLKNNKNIKWQLLSRKNRFCGQPVSSLLDTADQFSKHFRSQSPATWVSSVACGSQPTFPLFLPSIWSISLSYSLSVSHYYPYPSPADFTSLFTTYLRLAALPLIICTAFPTVLDVHLFPSRAVAVLLCSVYWFKVVFSLYWVG